MTKIQSLRDAVAGGYGLHLEFSDAKALLAEIDGRAAEPRELPGTVEEWKRFGEIDLKVGRELMDAASTVGIPREELEPDADLLLCVRLVNLCRRALNRDGDGNG